MIKHVAGFLLTVLVTGCSSVGTSMTEIAPLINASLEAEVTVLAPGDRVGVRFAERPDWNHEVTIQQDGTASFLLIGQRTVAGMTLTQLTADLLEEYSKTIYQYDLTLFLAEKAPRNIAVLGSVRDPGRVLLPDGRATLIDGLALAGGENLANANLGNIFLVRWLATEGRLVSWHIDARVQHWGDGDPILLQPYDTIYVPQKAIVKVNVWIDQYIRRLFPYLFNPILGA